MRPRPDKIGRFRVRVPFTCVLLPGHWVEPSTSWRGVEVPLPELAECGDEVSESQPSVVCHEIGRTI